MAPSGRTTTSNNNNTSRTKIPTSTSTSTTNSTRITTRSRTRARKTRFKKEKQTTKKEHIINLTDTSATVNSNSCCFSIRNSQDSSKEKEMEISEVIDVSNNVCLTPKGQKFRIPEISTCPPAPKKQRVLSNCSLRRSPLSFFTPPDLEHFFLVAVRDVSV